MVRRQQSFLRINEPVSIDSELYEPAAVSKGPDLRSFFIIGFSNNETVLPACVPLSRSVTFFRYAEYCVGDGGRGAGAPR